MSSIVYDDPTKLPEETPEARLALVGGNYAVIDLDLTSSTGAGIRADGTDHILIGANRTVTGQTYGLDLTGHGSIVTNQGTIRSLSETGAAIRLTGVDPYSILNLGTITAAGLAVEGSIGVDRIVNTGSLTTTATNKILLDLKDGNDFYDGLRGTTTGGIIRLGGGNDTAYGGAGSETFAGGAGDDYLHGGGGADTADYSEASSYVTVDLGKTTAQNIDVGQTISGGQGFDTLIDIENLVGSTFNDMLTGGTSDNILWGGDGNDSLNGGQGHDRLEGGNNDDMLEGGAGNDTLDGGAGTNTARYSGSAGARVDLTRSGAQNTVSYGVDILIGIVNLEGGSGADEFTGNSADNRLIGNGGNDILKGGGGNDFLDGGTGTNTAVFFGASTEYTISAKNPDGTYTVTDNHAAARDGVDTLKNVRLVKFSDKTVALTNGGPTGFELFPASMSEDKAVGAALGSFYATDPDGDPLTYSIVSNPGGFFGLNGNGKGLVLTKKLDYETATKHTITIKVDDQYGGVLTKTFTISVYNVVETTPLVLTGTSKEDQLVGEAGNDKLLGLAGNDRLFGQIGNDALNGGTGNDTVAGGVGNDTLTGGAGSDVLFGDKGKDVFVFDQKPNVSSNLDYIQDFTPTDDVIHLSRSIFTKIAKGTLSSKAFVVGNQFKDKDDRILHLKEAGALFYDPDGTGSAKAIQFANLGKNLKLTSKDFYIL
jgi:Ca2+-binding RTX toxin-like protein